VTPHESPTVGNTSDSVWVAVPCAAVHGGTGEHVNLIVLSLTSMVMIVLLAFELMVALADWGSTVIATPLRAPPLRTTFAPEAAGSVMVALGISAVSIQLLFISTLADPDAAMAGSV
jgi:hypothetical protein